MKKAKFKVGDTVMRIVGDHRKMKVNEIDVVTHYTDNLYMDLQKYGKGHDPTNFELVTIAPPEIKEPETNLFEI